MLDVNIKGIDLKFNTSNEVFSPQNVDKGTSAMLSTVEFKTNDKVLDLGCGYGIVGILAAKIVGASNVVMTDVDVSAVKLASENITLNDIEGIGLYQSDGFKNIHDKEFNLILSNPPYHVDFSVPKEFIEKGFNRLVVGGKMFMVTKRKDWYKNKLISIFGGVKISEIDGYYVFMAEKKTTTYSNKKK
ncbi:class I SAM-dependent methyltransferase [Clostridium sp.]|uniref:class I SAM-dependent methyltransferase n=1 Tax=Clostridium sp. TaxID=1506 RepID=UPI003D6CD7EE